MQNCAWNYKMVQKAFPAAAATHFGILHHHVKLLVLMQKWLNHMWKCVFGAKFWNFEFRSF